MAMIIEIEISVQLNESCGEERDTESRTQLCVVYLNALARRAIHVRDQHVHEVVIHPITPHLHFGRSMHRTVCNEIRKEHSMSTKTGPARGDTNRIYAKEQQSREATHLLHTFDFVARRLCDSAFR